MIVLETGFALFLVVLGFIIVGPPIVLIVTKYMRWWGDRISKL